MKVLVGQVLIGGPLELGHLWSRGINTGTSLTMDPWLLEGFQCSSSGRVLVLWFHGDETLVLVQLEAKILSSAHVLAA